jgi:hypothetical protein
MKRQVVIDFVSDKVISEIRVSSKNRVRAARSIVNSDPVLISIHKLVLINQNLTSRRTWSKARRFSDGR